MGLNCMDSNLCVAYCKCITQCTHCHFVYKLVDRPDLETQLLTRFVGFWNRSFKSENEIVSLCCHASLLSASTSSVRLVYYVKFLVWKLNLSQPFSSFPCQEIVTSLIFEFPLRNRSCHMPSNGPEPAVTLPILFKFQYQFVYYPRFVFTIRGGGGVV